MNVKQTEIGGVLIIQYPSLRAAGFDTSMFVGKAVLARGYTLGVAAGKYTTVNVAKGPRLC